MKLLYRVLRFIAVVVLCLAVIIPAVTYVALSLTPVQRLIAGECERELSQLLDCKVTVGDLGIVPFNRVVLRNVVVEVAPGDTAFTARRLGAGVRLWSFVSGDPVTVNYVELTGLDARLWRADRSSQLNIAPIIAALQPKEKNKPPTRFDLRVNTVLLRSSKFSYDVLSEPRKETFDPSHVAVTSLQADIRLPRIKNDDFVASVKRMGFREQSGFALDNLVAEAHLSATELAVRNLSITLPATNVVASDFVLPLEGISSIGKSLKHNVAQFELSPKSYVSPVDFSAFVPALRRLGMRVNVDAFMVEGCADNFTAKIALSDDADGRIALAGYAKGLCGGRREVSLQELSAKASGGGLQRIIECFSALPKAQADALSRMGLISLDGGVDVGDDRLNVALSLTAAPGGIDVLADADFRSVNDFTAHAEVATQGDVDLSLLAIGDITGNVDGVLRADVARRHGRFSGMAAAEIDKVALKGHTYTGLHAQAELTPDELLRGSVAIDNEPVKFSAEGAWSLAKHHKSLAIDVDVDRFVPSHLNLWGKYPGGDLSGRLHAAFEGDCLSTMAGEAEVANLRFTLADGDSLELKSLKLLADSAHLTLRSDYVDGELRGAYDFPGIAAACRRIVAHSFPSLMGNGVAGTSAQGASAERDGEVSGGNDFTFDLTVKETEAIANFFKLPLSVVYPMHIHGELSEEAGDVALTLQAPYLRQGNKLIENTRFAAYIAGSDGTSGLDFTTSVPTKNGPMTLVMQNTGMRDYMNSALSWKIDRARAYEGHVGAVTTFSRNDDGASVTTVNLMPGELTFNDSTWVVNPAKVTIDGPKHVIVDGINVHRRGQYVKINGTVADDVSSMLTLDLRNFSLDYLFESLGIDKVMLGGDAYGTFYASRLLSGEPVLETPGLNVKGISYNKTVIGDAVVKSRWDADNNAVTLDAVIDQENGRRSAVDGAIFPMNDSLDITFNVDHARIGFMQPYMEAFASDISGYASGRARIWGNFKYIDLEGDVCANDLRLRVNFTNTYYTAAGDSVHFRPGLIDLNGITIRDAEGHAASLNGWVRHKFFKEPRFEFGITGAHDFLSYNETQRENPVWHGKIYGNGSAFVKGEPGRVDINVDMATASHSTFTFVLSDQEVADEYSFLTFRDKGKMSAELTDTLLLERDTSMDLVNRLKAMVDAHNEDSPSDYNISLQMRVTPDAQIVLVMDPVGGDRIRAYGSGHLRMDYGSANNDLKMYGTYTLDRGDYNFTLQDVIIKDFIIKPGSEIVFNGDPYGALLKIQAVYALNANLSDLDESFLQDKDLNRTNVPVHALMKVNGDIRQPEITFDLEFPTLTTDIYRKVRSIISTDDMMNRQIIYLLALNRFYTPEYMTSTTKGNELVSVASSTISSQLSNMLGQISDNWNIAPTFRSDRGDFSDVEVDVALSSRLLNNRLLFNGNFGYRDNSLNTNQFIGDFDLEYILDREGMWRLKAYNRYNDQNYYLRTAHTTQGVGVVLKRDFDSFLSFIRRLRRKKSDK